MLTDEGCIWHKRMLAPLGNQKYCSCG